MTRYDVRIGICTKEGGINAVIDRELLRCLRRALKKEKEFLQENTVGIAWGRGKEGRHDRQKETCKGNRGRRQWACLGADSWRVRPDVRVSERESMRACT